MICSSPLGLVFSSVELPPSGEMGIVERSTGEVGLLFVGGASSVDADMVDI